MNFGSLIYLNLIYIYIYIYMIKKGKKLDIISLIIYVIKYFIKSAYEDRHRKVDYRARLHEVSSSIEEINMKFDLGSSVMKLGIRL